MLRLLIILVLGWFLCCMGGALGGTLGCMVALGWPLSPGDLSGSALYGLRPGAMIGVGVVVASALVRSQIRHRIALLGAGCVLILVALKTYMFVAAGAAV